MKSIKQKIVIIALVALMLNLTGCSEQKITPTKIVPKQNKEQLLGTGGTLAFGGGSDGSSGTGTSITWSQAISGSDTLLVVGVLNLGDTDQVTGATYNGTSMSLVRKDHTTVLGGHEWMYIFALIAPAAGTHNVVVSQSATSASLIGSSVYYTGAKQATNPDNNNFKNQAGATTAMSVAVVTQNDNDWLVGYMWISNNMTASSGTTARNGTNDTLRFFDSNGAKSPAGSYHLDVTYASSANTNAQIISIAPVAATVNIQKVDNISTFQNIDNIIYTSIQKVDNITK